MPECYGIQVVQVVEQGNNYNEPVGKWEGDKQQVCLLSKMAAKANGNRACTMHP